MPCKAGWSHYGRIKMTDFIRRFVRYSKLPAKIRMMQVYVCYRATVSWLCFWVNYPDNKGLEQICDLYLLCLVDHRDYLAPGHSIIPPLPVYPHPSKCLSLSLWNISHVPAHPVLHSLFHCLFATYPKQSSVTLCCWHLHFLFSSFNYHGTLSDDC